MVEHVKIFGLYYRNAVRMEQPVYRTKQRAESFVIRFQTELNLLETISYKLNDSAEFNSTCTVIRSY